MLSETARRPQGFVKELGSETWASLKTHISALISNMLNPLRKKLTVKSNTVPEGELAPREEGPLLSTCRARPKVKPTIQ